ncbi:MAG: hypothetical protein PHQ23_13520, partial [Candidatus Wallbacteria bacterium]|nr:hypothetical protein [Candidatus Wallbacteria bacterium]
MIDPFRLIKELAPYRGNTLQIELTDRCNLHCPNCNQGRGSGNVHGIEPGFMHPGLFRKIMDDLKISRMKFFEVQPFWFGESLLHPDFEHMFSLLLLMMEQSSLFAQIDLHTNAQLLDERLTELLIFSDIKMPVLTVSIDASSEETYNIVRPGGALKQVQDNVFNLIRRREQLGQVLPTVRVQFLLFEENRKDLTSFIEYWGGLFERVSRKNAVYESVNAYFDGSNFRDRFSYPDTSRSLWPDDIFPVSHPIYAHEQWRLDYMKTARLFRDSIWIKRPNALPLARQEELDRLFAETVMEKSLKSSEQERFRLFVEPDNRLPEFRLDYFGQRSPCA